MGRGTLGFEVARTLFGLPLLWHTHVEKLEACRSCMVAVGGIPCVFLRPITLEFTALDLRELSASLSHIIGAVKPPSKKAGSVLFVSISFALMEVM